MTAVDGTASDVVEEDEMFTRVDRRQQDIEIPISRTEVELVVELSPRNTSGNECKGTLRADAG